MTNVYLENIDTGEVLIYPSYKAAADAVGMNNATFIYRYKAGKECNGFIRTDSAIKLAAVDIESDVPRVELDRPHYAWINGKEYVAVKCTDKTSCKACDIFKLDPPTSMFQVPLCYEHNCGTHKIVDVCSRYKCIWKRKKNLQNK